MTLRPRDFLALGRMAALRAEDKKAKDVVLLDVRRLTGLADFFLLASVESQPQLQAVHSHVMEAIELNYGLSPLHRDGLGSPQWVVLDYGGLVVHLFHQSAREFYGLERLWEGARTVDFQPDPAPPKKETRAKASKKRK